MTIDMTRNNHPFGWLLPIRVMTISFLLNIMSVAHHGKE